VGISGGDLEEIRLRRCALLIVGITLATGGGITQKVSQQLGLREGLVEIYNQNALPIMLIWKLRESRPAIAP
jgi:hypothetical protein